MKKLLFILIFSVGPYSSYIMAQIDNTLINTWQGVITEVAGISYTAELVIDTLVIGQTAGQSNYSSLPCTGELIFASNIDSLHIFSEIILNGICSDSGNIEIYKLSEDSIQFNWYYSNGIMGSNGQLIRILTYVPDNNFEAYLEANGMGNGIVNDNYVTTANINLVTTLNVGSQNISDLTGIEDFIVLDSLLCDDNQLSTVDVSQNTALNFLYCYNNQLTSLDVSQNTALTYLACGSNQLTSLDVSQNTALSGLLCSNNQLTSLDVSQNTALTWLNCWNNQLTSLDVSNNTALSSLTLMGTQITTLDVSNNTNLNYLDLDSCHQLTSLNISNNTALTILFCSASNLTILNTSNNTALQNLFFSDNDQITSLDLSNNTALSGLYCNYNNQITSLDLRNGNNTNISSFSSTNNPNLSCILVDDPAYSAANWVGANFTFDPGISFSMFCTPQTNTPDNNFESYLEANGMGNGILGDDSVNTINISSVANLNVGGLNISDLTGIEDFSSLQYLDCSNNNLSSIDVSNNTQLSNLQCEANQLNTLIFDASLTSLDCFDNQLTSLDLSNNPNLAFLNCSHNNLTEINVQNGNNALLANPNFIGNECSCIKVDDEDDADDDWILIDDWSSYGVTSTSPNSWDCIDNACIGQCTGTGEYTSLIACQDSCSFISSVVNINNNTKELLKIVDVLGRETKQRNQTLFYIYGDGTVEKKIFIE